MGAHEWLAHRRAEGVVVDEEIEEEGETRQALLRSHVVARVRHARTNYKRAGATHELRRSLMRLHRMAERGDVEDLSLGRAMCEICVEALLFQDARRLAEAHGITVSVPDDDENELEVAYFPIVICYDPAWRPPAPLRRVRPQPRNADGDGTVEYVAVPPCFSLLLTVDAIAGRLAVFVFRAPRLLVTRVTSDSYVGVAENACTLLMHSDIDKLAHAADDFTKNYGAQWVWVHAEADTYRAGPRGLRERGVCPLAVTKKSGGLVVQREGVRWRMGHLR